MAVIYEIDVSRPMIIRKLILYRKFGIRRKAGWLAIFSTGSGRYDSTFPVLLNEEQVSKLRKKNGIIYITTKMVERGHLFTQGSQFTIKNGVVIKW